MDLKVIVVVHYSSLFKSDLNIEHSHRCIIVTFLCMRNMTRTLTTVCVTHLLPKQLTDCPQKANISPRGVRKLIVLAVYIDTGEKSGIQRKNVKTSGPI